MDGLTFLRQLMREDEPVPVVVCSGLAGPGSEAAVRALRGGRGGDHPQAPAGRGGLPARVTGAVRGGLRNAARAASPAGAAGAGGGAGAGVLGRAAECREPALALAADGDDGQGGGGGGLHGGHARRCELLLEAMPPDCPGLVIVQHMPELFTVGLREAVAAALPHRGEGGGDGDRVLQGRALIAPGNRHLRVRRSGGALPGGGAGRGEGVGAQAERGRAVPARWRGRRGRTRSACC